MKLAAIFLAAAAAAPGAAWAVYKCPLPGGGTAFQDQPCEGGAVINVKPASGPARVAKPQAPATAPAEAAAPAPAAKPAPQAVAQVNQEPARTPPGPLDNEARMCLAWYRPMLRDPSGAYFSNPAKDGRVLSIDVHATNGFGGYVIKRAACEINAGRLDDDWTKIHAARGGW